MLPINTQAYVVTSPYTSVQVPLATAPIRPVNILQPNLIYNQTTFLEQPTMLYTTLTDNYIHQQSNLNASACEYKNDNAKFIETSPAYLAPTAFIQPAQKIVYTSVVGDLINQQSILNAEKKVDDKINKTVQEQIKRYESDKLKEEELKKRLAEYEAKKLENYDCHHHHNHHHHNHHDHVEHEIKNNCEHEKEHHHHHHLIKYERTQGSQTDLSLGSLSLKDEKKCCCKSSSEHKLPICSECICSHSDICLEEKIRRIREELKLPPEHKSIHDHRECVTPDKPKVTFSSKTSECDRRESRSRSKSKSANTRSRSQSIDKPIWRPTGSNDYSWAHQTRAEILSGQYRPASGSNHQSIKQRSTSSDKSNQTAFAQNDITVIYPSSQTINQYYHEIPVNVETTTKKVKTRSRSNSKPRSGSPAWRYTNKNDYSWTTQTYKNYDDYYNNTTTKSTTTTVYDTTKSTTKPSEVIYTYETVRPKTSVDHFYFKTNSNNNSKINSNPNTYYYVTENLNPVHTDYYYIESTKPKPKTVTFESKGTSTSTNNAIGTQTIADKGASSSLECSRDALNKFNVYVK